MRRMRALGWGVVVALLVLSGTAQAATQVSTSDRLKVLEHGEPFFARHGPKAVFLGRWVAGLRIASAWLAGMNKMPWPTFLFWNALGGIAWAVSISLSIYFLGDLAEHAIEVVGPISAGIVVAALIAFWVYRRRRKAVEARATNSGIDGE